VNIVCCQVEVSVMSQSFIQRSPNEFICVTEYDEVHQNTLHLQLVGGKDVR